MLKLHDYQHRAIKFGLKHKTVFFAMDMGLGKTVVSLRIKEAINQPAFVVAPLSGVYTTWPEEIQKWSPLLTYSILHGPNKNFRLTHDKPDVFIINFDGLKWFAKEVVKRHVLWAKRMLIIDESSMIKSPTTLRFKLLKKMMPLWSDYRFCLSATPSPNGYHELWSQYFMLDKGKCLFDNYYRFRGTYFSYTGPPLFKTTIRKGSYEAIRDNIRPITFRLDAYDYLNMPKTIHNVISLELPKKLRSQYKELEDNFFLEFANSEATAFSAAALSMKLRQFIQGAVYTDAKKGEFYPLHQIKINALKELLETCAGQPILCAIQFKFERRMINEFIGYNIPCIAGGTSINDRNGYIRKWNRGDIPLLLCHPASLSHSVNLQAGGHIMLWFGLTWSMEQYKQLNGRLIRQGQVANSVTVNHLIMKNTIDERVVKVLKEKDATQQKLLDALKR